ncbi:MAG TPA: hypothetical protein ENJ82_17955 [Bacteroidetes bacterium]|nr:hypothetical protein [Bacteroidota bacterium]
MKHFKILLITIFCTFSLWACDTNPGWDGSQPAGAAEVLAKETCKCIYEVMAEMEDVFDIDLILDKMLEKNKGTTEIPDIDIALKMEAAISIKVDDCECMKPVNDAAFNRGVELEDLLNAVDKHCTLGVFYN